MFCKCTLSQLQNLHQAITDIMKICLLVTFLKTIISFWNMMTASAPIQATEAMVKYWISNEQMVQPASLWVRSIPMRKNRSMRRIATHNWTWKMLISRFRIVLLEQHKKTVHAYVIRKKCAESKSKPSKRGNKYNNGVAFKL